MARRITNVHLLTRPDLACTDFRRDRHVTFCARNSAMLRTNLMPVADLVGEAGMPSAVPLVGVIMGSDSDLPCMKAAADVLAEFGVPHEVTIVSAHRTPERMMR